MKPSTEIMTAIDDIYVHICFEHKNVPWHYHLSGGSYNQKRFDIDEIGCGVSGHYLYLIIIPINIFLLEAFS